MIFRVRLDISWGELALGGIACLLPGNRRTLESQMLGTFPDGDRALVCLSVRSSFDVLLRAMDLPQGSEVLLSAITVPDMACIVREHGLVPVPVDLDPDTLAPDLDSLRAAATPRSKLLVVAHLFGAVVDLQAARTFAKERGLRFVEDCAQSYIPGHFAGSADSDVRMLSFGPIKTHTALGGAVVFVANEKLRARMGADQDRLPVQPRGAFTQRWFKHSMGHLLSFEPPFTLFRMACRLSGRDFDAVLRDLARTYRGPALFSHLRLRPSTPLLALLSRRLLKPSHRVNARAAAGSALAKALPTDVRRPGARAETHTHWVFPVLTDAPLDLMHHLRRWGFDATDGTSSLTAIPAPAERPEMSAPHAHSIMARILFVPAYPEISAKALRRLAESLTAWHATDRKETNPAPTEGTLVYNRTA